MRLARNKQHADRRRLAAPMEKSSQPCRRCSLIFRHSRTSVAIMSTLISAPHAQGSKPISESTPHRLDNLGSQNSSTILNIMPDFVPLSACVEEGLSPRCAIEASQCPSGSEFQLDNVALYDHPSCNDVEDIETGRCDDTGRCAYDANGCKDPSTYRVSTPSDDQGCTIGVDQDSGEFTRHSKCERDGLDLCMVGDCSDGTMTAHVKECHCGAVWTGACVDEQNGLYYCAVSEDSCIGNTFFRDAHQLYRGNEIDCRLCSHLYYEHPGPKQISEPVAFGVGVFFGVVPLLLIGCCWLRCCRHTNTVPGATKETEMS